MSYKIRKLNYYYAITQDKPGEAHKILSILADVGVNQLAFNTMQMGPERAQITLFPEDESLLVRVAKTAGLNLDGPYNAILVQGTDEMGALVEVHEKLHNANINIASSTAIADGSGSYGYLIYLRPDDYDKAADALSI
ncbi:MAG: hypothetical protein KAS35_05390 [Candidatus Marinimicrobia bacterium]|jgi:hypothetical protein|nr:hypothetical protein [Candidatus Neomarinimicrobiota bacterium]